MTISPAELDDAIKSLTRRQLEALQTRITKELQSCLLCGSEGAESVSIVIKAVGTKSKVRASLLLCKPCLEKHRLPESRSGESS